MPQKKKESLEFFFFFLNRQKKYALVCITETLEGNRFSSSSNVSPCNHLVQPDRHLSATRTHTHIEEDQRQNQLQVSKWSEATSGGF